jgi:excisionase family DNA binding protein
VKAMNSDFEPLVDAGEIAELLVLHPKTVQLMARQGKIPAIRIGKFWRFRKSEIDHWLRCEVNCAGYACRQNEEDKS